MSGFSIKLEIIWRPLPDGVAGRKQAYQVNISAK